MVREREREKEGEIDPQGTKKWSVLYSEAAWSHADRGLTKWDAQLLYLLCMHAEVLLCILYVVKCHTNNIII